jgi:hypothetical protein
VSTREHLTFTAAQPLTPFTAVAMAADKNVNHFGHAIANQRGRVFLRSLALFLALVFVSNLAAQTSVTTYHNDTQRTGWNSHESILAPVNVAPNSFGWLFTVLLDDQVDTQPLVVANVAIPGMGVHAVVYVTTENNTVYAIDADTGASLITPRNLGSPVAFRGDGKDVKDPLSCFNNGPNVGINGTGTIDPSTNTLYILAFVNDAGVPEYDFHALDITTLKDRPGSPVKVVASQGVVNFTAAVQRQRAGLLDANGRIYAAFASFCDYAGDRARGWVLSWDKSTFSSLPGAELTNSLRSTNANTCTWPGNTPCYLAAIWMSGYGVASDPSGNVYFTTGNTAPSSYNSGSNLAESAVKMSPDLSTVLQFFTPSNESSMDTDDTDYGSGGLLVLPDQGGAFPHVAVGAGKDGRFWVLNRDSMGGQHTPDIPNNVPIGDCWCGPSYFGTAAGGVVVASGGDEKAPLQKRQITTWLLTTSGSQPSLSPVASAPAIEGSPQDGGFFTSTSSNGTGPNTAIIWAVGRAAGADNHVTLYAYNATPQGGTLPLLWSGPAGNWPNVGGNANIVPTVANGRVYVASNKQLQIFGLLPSQTTIWKYTGPPCSGRSCPGWQQLDNNSKTITITAGDSLYQLHNDGMIWQSNGTPCSGPNCPGWTLLDRNSKTVAISADGPRLYQLHNDGMIWRYTGTPCSGNSCPGWQMLDNNSKAVAIASSGGNLYELHNDGMIWHYTGVPCSGNSCPGWQMLDNNSKAVAISADGGSLYELHNDGMIWRYTGTPCSGNSCPGWQMLDNNSKAVAVASSGGELYELHNDGMIWRYTGTPCSGNSCSGWQMLDNNSKAVAISAEDGNLYELHNDGMIWRYTGTPCSGNSCPGWQMFDDNFLTSQITSGPGQLYQLHGGPLYQLHTDGSIWRYTGIPCGGSSCIGWQELDVNPATTAIASAGKQLFQLHNDGSIWRYTGTPCSGSSCPGWQQLDNNPRATAITGGDQLFQLHNDGSIWRYTGTPCSGPACPGWQELDVNPATTAVVAAGKQLFQLHNDGSIWRYTGTPCSGSSCPGWQELDNNPQATAIAAGDQLFQIHRDGSIWRYTGTPCSGSSCPGWQELDVNPATTAILAAGAQLFQLHGDGSIWRYTGTPCTGPSCPGWQMLDNNPQAKAISAGDQVYQLHQDGSIWRYTGTPCRGSRCPGWQELDINPAASAISAAYAP